MIDPADPIYDDFFDQVEVKCLNSYTEDDITIHVFVNFPELPGPPGGEELSDEEDFFGQGLRVA